MRIDAHLHIWNRSRARYDWLDGQPPEIDRDIHLDEVLPHLDRAGVDQVVLVQSADNAEDTRNMLDVARTHDRVAGVVGWLPLEDPEATRQLLDGFVRDPLLVGVRNLIHDRPDPDWAIRPDFTRGLALLAAAELPYDYVTADPGALRHVPHLSAQHPDLRLVIDHLGKPPIGRDEEAGRHWRDLLADAAAHPLVHAKISGLYSSVGAGGDWTLDDLRRVVGEAAALFGPERLMRGGDWPVSLLAGGYDRVADALDTVLTETFGPHDLAQVDGVTAARFYRLRSGSRRLRA
ncbi:amidohydrolase family protein [Rathayibacter caricis]|uniref:amidohydrolase family protein n=1 Tax=Rathayibacter caricis TaxID=110936 RepID=UPI001FB4F359|nr:amidohydrolase family protein [Rathayibacter caricis]MCJ1697771.1 amidohydrolase family protein [Rathayibacter caricis]